MICAIGSQYLVPGAIIAVPAAEPFGMSPGGLARNRSWSWPWDIASSWGTSYAIAISSAVGFVKPGIVATSAAIRSTSAAIQRPLLCALMPGPPPSVRLKMQPAAREHDRQRPGADSGGIDHQSLLHEQTGQRDLADQQDEALARAAPHAAEKWIERTQRRLGPHPAIGVEGSRLA